MRHPEICVDIRTGKGRSLVHDLPDRLRESYGAAIFVSQNFTKGFMDRDERVNAFYYNAEKTSEGVTVREAIAIARGLLSRKDFERHIVNRVGAIFTAGGGRTAVGILCCRPLCLAELAREAITIAREINSGAASQAGR